MSMCVPPPLREGESKGTCQPSSYYTVQFLHPKSPPLLSAWFSVGHRIGGGDRGESKKKPTDRHDCVLLELQNLQNSEESLGQLELLKQASQKMAGLKFEGAYM